MVAIGVGGHRVPVDQEKLEAGLDALALRIAAAFPGEPWTVISALAERADRIVARRLLARPATRLVAVLPLAADDYEADFSAAASLRGSAHCEVLDRADVLVAVWDEQCAQGQGGTAAIVAQARKRSAAGLGARRQPPCGDAGANLAGRRAGRGYFRAASRRRPGGASEGDCPNS